MFQNRAVLICAQAVQTRQSWRFVEILNSSSRFSSFQLRKSEIELINLLNVFLRWLCNRFLFSFFFFTSTFLLFLFFFLLLFTVRFTFIIAVKILKLAFITSRN